MLEFLANDNRNNPVSQPTHKKRREVFGKKNMSNILNRKLYTQNEINEQRRNDTAGRCSTQSSVEADKTFV